MPNRSYIGPAIVVVLIIAVIAWFLYQGLSGGGGLSASSLPDHP
jgi:hypothetical protein